ncbi:hypothetical protein [Nocardia sp. SYP-A9097]|uniref:hypothetical protein n=1 Tax=Nocardia sp. SYP-A9097 TaxID=2663237 RepID=UPI0018913957|nr:hypothetical protein [Nocardia sp. SYP-A9097]
MYPSQPVAPEGPRHAAPQVGQGMPGQSPRKMNMNHQRGGGKYSALASFVTYVKAMEAIPM